MADSPACLALILAHAELPGGGPAALLPVAGSTLLERAVRLALASPPVARVAVACSDLAVTDGARAAGAEVVTVDAGPEGATEAVVRAAVPGLGDGGPAILVAIDATACLLQPGDVSGLLSLLEHSRADSAAGVVPVTGAAWRLPGGAGAAGAVVDSTVETGAAVMDAGILYATRRQGLSDSGRVLHGRTALYPLPSWRGFRLTVAADRDVAEAHLGAARRHDRSAGLPARPAALVMDFDGVFTDNKVLVDETGREAVRCDRSDGLGLERLRATGLPLLVLSKERNPVVQARCRKLKLECLQGIDDKRPALEQWCRQRGLDLARVIYVGNDINDLACLEAAGCAVVVADAYDEAKRAADIILDRPGGHGALRELADLLLARLAQIP